MNFCANGARRLERYEGNLAGNRAGLRLWKVQEKPVQFQTRRAGRVELFDAESFEGTLMDRTSLARIVGLPRR